MNNNFTGTWGEFTGCETHRGGETLSDKAGY